MKIRMVTSLHFSRRLRKGGYFAHAPLMQTGRGVRNDSQITHRPLKKQRLRLEGYVSTFASRVVPINGPTEGPTINLPGASCNSNYIGESDFFAVYFPILLLLPHWNWYWLRPSEHNVIHFRRQIFQIKSIHFLLNSHHTQFRNNSTWLTFQFAVNIYFLSY